MIDKSNGANGETESNDKKEVRDHSSFSVPSISVPKGGGAIRDIGEKFGVNPVTGTGYLSVPISTSPGRSNFGPQLSLSYDSGSGNGPLGFGWGLSLPSITRKTDKGLPRYQDAIGSDTFILSGAEDLVPVTPNQPPSKGSQFEILLYRPRIEGLFARIERWTNKENGDIHWRSISKDNITTLYGKTEDSRIEDPAGKSHDPKGNSRIFSWLICESHDDKGNAIYYKYKKENSAGVDVSKVNEKNRNKNQGQIREANSYLKCIYYGNTTPYQPGENLELRKDWLFCVVFDYDEGHYEELPDENGLSFVRATKEGTKDWSPRNDPFSSCRAGFEVRTYRLCHRIMMFHNFEELKTNSCLVRSTELIYNTPCDAPSFSSITKVIQSGYVFRAEDKYLKRSLPPLEFEYSKAIIGDKIYEIDGDSLENLPIGIDGSNYRWVDLDGEGISGILAEQAGTWFYKRNISPISIQEDENKNPVKDEFGNPQLVARFRPIEIVRSMPSLANLGGGRQQLVDLAGDGQLDLAEFSGPVTGFYERTQDQGWEQFAPFRSLPNIDWNDPNLRFIDLTGDGHADILIAEGEVFTWYGSIGEEGFSLGEKVGQALDEEDGPRLVFSDGTQSIHLADMSGDGLIDIVRISKGEVCYWPNLGYGRFGAKVTMDDSPYFEYIDQFNQRQIILADIDGSGTTDIIYLGGNGVQIYYNHSGNELIKLTTSIHFPKIDNHASITAVDLLGNGTASLVWSSSLPVNAGRQMRYVNLMGMQKPHLLVSVKNNMGAETRVTYATSTKFYLKDQEEGNPWITKIPFPVHVVERVDTFDWISKNRFVTRYAYHHGYFDGIEREFRGFGMVEQCDTEEFAALNVSGDFPIGVNISEASYVPPVLTKTWYHTGAYLQGERISHQLIHEYYGARAPSECIQNYEDALKDFEDSFLLHDTVLPDTLTFRDKDPIPWNLSAEEQRQASRALKGSILRQEIYAQDDSPKSKIPYSVSERNYSIVLLQPQGQNQHAVFFVHPREAIDYHYERNPDDPRISHALTLEVDAFGNVLKSAAIGYGRLNPDTKLSEADQEKQSQLLITCTENKFTENIDLEDAYRTPLPYETSTYELTGLKQIANGCFKFETLKDAVDIAAPISYEASPSQSKEKRLIECVRALYRKDDLSGPLPLGKLVSEPIPPGTPNSMALPFETYKQAFTKNLIDLVYKGRATEDMSKEGKYVHSEGDDNWWIPSGKVFYSPNAGDTPEQELSFAKQHFFLPHRFEDPFGSNTVVTYDKYDLLLQEITDPLHNITTVNTKDDSGNSFIGLDYRVLQPYQVTDLNGNRTAVAFDALGMVVGTAVMGKPENDPKKGDWLDSAFRPDLTQAEIDQFFADPKGPLTALLLNNATNRIIYDLTGYWLEFDPKKKQPAFAATLARETHAHDPVPEDGLKIQMSFSYSDGFGREIQKKIQAELGPVPIRDLSTGLIITDANGQPEMSEEDVNPPPLRWVGSGWTVFNNKGKPVRQYEPFFTDTHRFEFDVHIGVSPVLFYDPVERVIATIHPNHTYEKVVFDPWHQETYDVNDTVASDPRTDEDIHGYVAEYFKQEATQPGGWKTWIAQRGIDPLAPPQNENGLDAEQKAAVRTLLHANTPTVAYFDSLGRTFLTVSHNKFKRSDAPPAAPPTEEFCRARVILDIEGNQRAARDERKDDQGNPEERIVMLYDYDMLSNRIHQASMEAGERWMLNDVTGKAIHAWDSRDHHFHNTYDPLRRPIDTYMHEGAGPELLVGQTVYGETMPNPETKNIRGKVYQIFDQAGTVISDEYDFKGNLLCSRRQLAVEYKDTLNWAASVELEEELFSRSAAFDALNRPIQVIAPHSNRAETKLNVIQPVYNAANLLRRMDVWLEQNVQPLKILDSNTATQNVIKIIDYDAKGHRKIIEYGNGVQTTYKYDLLTFRLINLQTLRGTEPLQDLFYTYDPVGNTIAVIDDAQKTIYYNGQVVKPVADYRYDAIYRLIEASCREHIGQATQPQTTWSDEFRVGLVNPNDGQAMRNYFESYEYDEAGNIKCLDHKANDGNWLREYNYNEQSQTESLTNKKSNRLSCTVIHPNSQHPIIEPCTYNVHGSIISMVRLKMIEWDFNDQLQMVDIGSGGKINYIYDASGKRVRKVIELPDGRLKEERLYIGGFEIFREYKLDDGSLDLERETLNIMDNKKRIALAEIQTKGNDRSPPLTLRYQLINPLGSSAWELDQDGKVITYEEYYSFGGTSFQAGNVLAEVKRKRYRYIGKERDERTGLYYFGARYYVPWLGRWISCDPISVNDSNNLYIYVHNNPLRFIDPNGKQSIVKENVLPKDAPPSTIWWIPGATDKPGWNKQDPKKGMETAKEHGVLVHVYDPTVDAIEFSTEQIHPNVPSEKGEGSPANTSGKSTELDYTTALVGKLFDPRSVSIDNKGVTGGIPGGHGPASFANPVGQLIYIGINLLFTFSDLPVIAMRKASSYAGRLFIAAWQRAGPKVLQMATAPAFMLLGTGGIGSGMLPKSMFNKSAGGATRPVQDMLKGARNKATRIARKELRERHISGTRTSADVESLTRLEEQKGLEAVEEFAKTGKSGQEGGHMFSASEYPENAHNPELIRFTDRSDHLWGQHGGDWANDPGGAYLDPDWESGWGMHITDYP